MVRAFLENVDKGGVEQGGSTITQQLIKNRVLKHPKRDLNRKIKEAALAIRLNEEWSKNHILEEYLNTVYFGQGSYGVKAAAARYFDNTPLDKIDLAQAALLAGLIKNPEGDNPFLHSDRAFIRRAQVLATMVKQHRITKAEAAAANSQPLPTVPPPAEFRPDNYYVATVRDLLTTDPRFGLGATDKAARGQAEPRRPEGVHRVRPAHRVPRAGVDRQHGPRDPVQGRVWRPWIRATET